MNVSLDLRIEQVPGDNGAGEWLRIDEELHREFNARARALALMVQGRVVYEIMEEYWPRACDDASLPEVLRDYGQIWTTTPKVLVSRTRRSADHNTRIIGGGGPAQPAPPPQGARPPHPPQRRSQHPDHRRGRRDRAARRPADHHRGQHRRGWCRAGDPAAAGRASRRVVALHASGDPRLR